MRLAEALTERSDIQKRIEQLRKRLKINAKVQAGEKPAEDPELLLKELNHLIDNLTDLITRINKTNSETMVDQESLTSLLAKRDTLALKIQIMRETLESASSTIMRNTKTEIKIISTISVAATQKKVDALSKELRQLDVKIQEVNWTTDLQ